MSLLAALSPRQREVARLVGVECLTCKGIGQRLGMSWRTVEYQRSQVMQKLGARNAVELARMLALEEANASLCMSDQGTAPAAPRFPE